MTSNIYLVGFMGTGKTAVGKLLAEKLQRKFIETDELIEKKTSMSIADIFSKQGEAYFRMLEKQVLQEVAFQKNLVVSCGGGIVIDQDNINLLKKTGILICLQADAETIYERTKKHSHRPLLNVSNPLQKIKGLLNKRKQFYAKARFSVNTVGFKPEEISTKILEIIRDA